MTAASNPHDGRRDPATPAADMPAVSATSNPPTGDRRTTAAAPAPGLSFMSSPAVELERSPVRALPRRDANVSLVGPDGLAPTWLLHVGPGVVRLAPRPRPRHEGRQSAEYVEARAVVARRARLRSLGARQREEERERSRRWARRSRSRMVLRLAELDYRPMRAEAVGLNGAPAMVTLTLPGDWERLVPGPPAMVRYMAAFRRRWERAIGPTYAVWKLEFQRRGAPHIHLLMACPQSVGDVVFVKWLSRVWYDVVGSGDDRHLKAGTGVDWREPQRMRDGRAIAVYFARYAAPGQAKSYQHIVPGLWRDAGRFRWWGYWLLKPLVFTVELDEPSAIEVRRWMRHGHRALNRRALSSTKVLSGNRRGRILGGFLLVPDGPRFASELQRALAVCAAAPHNPNKQLPAIGTGSTRR